MAGRIYDKSTRELIREFLKSFVPPAPRGFAELSARKPLSEGGHFTQKECVAWFAEHYPKLKSSTIIAHLGMFSTNYPSRIHYNAKPDGKSDVLFKTGPSSYRLYNPETDPAPIYDPVDIASDEDGEEDPGSDGGLGADIREFAYEKDLKMFLSKNLDIIKPGLRLYEEDELRGIEFPVDGRYIDILAVDGDTLVVIELKVSKGYDRAVGQLLRYMGSIEKDVAEPGQQVRGMIIARTITEDVKLATSRLNDVELFEYELSVSLRPISSS